MSGIRHDRSVIEAYGARWLSIAETVRANSLALAAGNVPIDVPNESRVPGSGSAVPPDKCARGDLRARRLALGLAAPGLAALTGCSNTSVKVCERLGTMPNIIARIEAALAKAEADKGEG
jgi:hypothetical protein